jgi:amino acid transporter
VLPSIINAVLVTSAFSCGAACIFLASRVLYGLAEEGQAPRFFLKTNRLGSPYLAVAASVIFLPLVYLGLGSNSSIAFSWFVNIATIAAMISWFIIAVTFLRFFYAMKAQGISRDRKLHLRLGYPALHKLTLSQGLPYKSPFQPYAAWTAAVALALVILFTGTTPTFQLNCHLLTVSKATASF